MKKGILLLIIIIAFDSTYSSSQKIESGIHFGVGDASIQNGLSNLRKSVFGYTIGAYVEQYVLENVSLQSSIQFIEKGAEEALSTTNNYKVYLDFIQYSIIPKIYIDEGTNNKLVVGIGFYFGISTRERFINDLPFEKKYAFSSTDLGVSG